MNSTENPYAILGISQDADDETIKKAYRRAAKLYHPDKQSNEADRKIASSKFAKIADAYDLLTDPVRRYDWRQANGTKQSANQKSTNQSSPVPKRSSTVKSTSHPPVRRSSSFGSAGQRSKRSSTMKPTNPPQVRRRSSFGPGTGRRNSEPSPRPRMAQSNAATTRRSNSTAPRRSRASVYEPTTSSSGVPLRQTRRASMNGPVPETSRRQVRHRAGSVPGMARPRGSIHQTVRSTSRPHRTPQLSPKNTRQSMRSSTITSPPCEKGRRKSRTPKAASAVPLGSRRPRRAP